MSLSKTELKAFLDFEKSGWEKAADPYHRHWGLLSSQSAGPMLDAAKIRKGGKVLDVATGAGYVAAHAAKRGACAIGIDFSMAQVELARKTYPDVEFSEGNAEALPYDDDTFDSIVMGFGINHLPNPEISFTEAYRVVKRGGWFAFTVWAAPQSGEGFGIVLSAIEEYGVPNPDLPAAPPYFRFSDSQEARRVFTETGFVDAKTEIVPQYWLHRTPDEVFAAFNEGAVRATAMLRSQPSNVRETIREVVRNEVKRLKQGDQYVISVPAALSSARKP